MEPECVLKAIKNAARNSEEKRVKKSPNMEPKRLPGEALGSPNGSPGLPRESPRTPMISRDRPGALPGTIFASFWLIFHDFRKIFHEFPVEFWKEDENERGKRSEAKQSKVKQS